MAHKRKLVVERKAEQAEDEGQPQELGWRDWFLRRYARSWYWIGALFLDMIIFLELQDPGRLGALGAGGLTILAIVIELFVYLKLWGKNGPLSEDTDDEDDE